MNLKFGRKIWSTDLTWEYWYILNPKDHQRPTAEPWSLEHQEVKEKGEPAEEIEKAEKPRVLWPEVKWTKREGRESNQLCQNTNNKNISR